MGSNGTKGNIGKPNIDAEDKIDGQPIDVETGESNCARALASLLALDFPTALSVSRG